MSCTGFQDRGAATRKAPRWFPSRSRSVPATDAGNTTLAITPAGNTTIGGTKTITATFAGLAAQTRHMGAVDYNNGSPIGRTIVRVNTP